MKLFTVGSLFSEIGSRNLMVFYQRKKGRRCHAKSCTRCPECWCQTHVLVAPRRSA